MDEQTLKQKKRQMLIILKEAREKALKEECEQALKLIKKVFLPLEEKVFGRKQTKFDILRNEIINMCWLPKTSKESVKELRKKFREDAKIKSLTLIAELEEELNE